MVQDLRREVLIFCKGFNCAFIDLSKMCFLQSCRGVYLFLNSDLPSWEIECISYAVDGCLVSQKTDTDTTVVQDDLIVPCFDFVCCSRWDLVETFEHSEGFWDRILPRR